MTWSAQQYILFEQQRTRPVRDLVAAIPNTEVRNAVDLGCGPGNSTEVLAERFPHAHVTGLDSSDDMLADARKRLPALSFELADIGAWNPAQTFDVILANASLQWLPDHATLYPHLVHQLTPGGTLAVQTPTTSMNPLTGLPAKWRLMGHGLPKSARSNTMSATRRATTTSCWLNTAAPSMCGAPLICTRWRITPPWWNGSRLRRCGPFWLR